MNDTDPAQAQQQTLQEPSLEQLPEQPIAVSAQRLDVVDLRTTPAFDAWKKDIHSQCGEDGIIEHLLATLGMETGYFVEFGAWDGRHLSNCAALADRGFSGCFIEGDAGRFADLVAAYPGRTDIARVHSLVSHEGPDRLDAILERVGAPREPTLLSIDIDGMDYHVWDAVQDYRPSICVIEFNPTIPAHVAFIQAKDPSQHQASSLAALYQLGLAKGYALVAVTEFNAFFLTEKLRAAHDLPSYLPENVKSRRYETAFFHGFDGSVFLAGDRTMLWHGVPIDVERVQGLPPELRRFPVGQTDEYYRRLSEFRSKFAKPV